MAEATLPVVALTSDNGQMARMEAVLATARLKAAAGDANAAASVPFEAVLQGSEVTPSVDGGHKDETVFQKFEAMALSQLVSAMMNASGDSMFGEGTAMSSYGSLFADAVGNEIAERGGIGIAESLARTHPGLSLR